LDSGSGDFVRSRGGLFVADHLRRQTGLSVGGRRSDRRVPGYLLFERGQFGLHRLARGEVAQFAFDRIVARSG